MKKFLYVVLFFTLCNFMQAHFTTTYYVSTSGNDTTGDGSIGNPWRSLVKATTVVTGLGDIIHVNAGTYTEVSSLSLYTGVSLEGADSSTTIIKSTVSANFVPLLNVSSATGTGGTQHISNLKFDGQLTNFLAVFIGGRSNVSIHDCSFRDFKDRGIIFSGKGDYTDGAPTTYSTGNSFYNNRVLNCANYIHYNGSYGMGCLNIGGQTDMDIYGNYIKQDQRVNDNGWPIKYANEGHLRNVKIHGNTLIKNVFAGNYNGDGDWDFCMEIWNPEGGFEIYNNTIQGGIDMAYNNRVAPYTYSFWIHDNTISQPSLNTKFQGGIYFERECNGAIVENNIFDKIAGGVLINIEDFGSGSYQRLSSIFIRKNVFSNIGRNIGNGNNGVGVMISTHNTATFDIDTLEIDNNTFVAASGNAPFEGIYLNYNVAIGTSNHIKIRNNIVQGFQDRWLYVSNSASTIDIFNVQNNQLYQNAASNLLFFANADPTHLTNTFNQIGDPLFVTPYSDFHLQSGSPCRSNALNIGYGTDIGKYQYASDITPPTVTSVTPLNGSTGQSTSVSITGTFSEELLSDSVNTRNATLDIAGTPVAISSVTYSPGTFKITLNLTGALSNNTTYNVKFKTGIVDASGNHLAAQYNYSFTTGSSTKRRYSLYGRRHS